MPDGTYDLHFNYRTADGEPLMQAVTAQGQLTVLGNLAKFGAPFNIVDVTDAIDYLLLGTSEGVEVSIVDVTNLIDWILLN